MAQYDKNDVAEDIDAHKIDGSRKCIIWHHWYVLKINFRFKPKVFEGYYDMAQISMNFDDAEGVVTFRVNDSRINFWFVTKNGAIRLISVIYSSDVQ